MRQPQEPTSQPLINNPNPTSFWTPRRKKIAAIAAAATVGAGVLIVAVLAGISNGTFNFSQHDDNTTAPPIPPITSTTSEIPASTTTAFTIPTNTTSSTTSVTSTSSASTSASTTTVVPTTTTANSTVTSSTTATTTATPTTTPTTTTPTTTTPAPTTTPVLILNGNTVATGQPVGSATAVIPMDQAFSLSASSGATPSTVGQVCITDDSAGTLLSVGSSLASNNCVSFPAGQLVGFFASNVTLAARNVSLSLNASLTNAFQQVVHAISVLEFYLFSITGNTQVNSGCLQGATNCPVPVANLVSAEGVTNDTTAEFCAVDTTKGGFNSLTATGLPTLMPNLQHCVTMPAGTVANYLANGEVDAFQQASATNPNVPFTLALSAQTAQINATATLAFISFAAKNVGHHYLTAMLSPMGALLQAYQTGQVDAAQLQPLVRHSMLLMQTGFNPIVFLTVFLMQTTVALLSQYAQQRKQATTGLSHIMWTGLAYSAYLPILATAYRNGVVLSGLQLAYNFGVQHAVNIATSLTAKGINLFCAKNTAAQPATATQQHYLAAAV